MCSERDSPLKRLYRRMHVKLTRLAGFGQLVWAAGCELSLALVHARRPAWPGETCETMLRVVPPRITRPPDHTSVNWPVDASASGSAQVGSGGRHRWAARVQVGREPARQKAREGYPSHYTSLITLNLCTPTVTSVDHKNYMNVRPFQNASMKGPQPWFILTFQFGTILSNLISWIRWLRIKWKPMSCPQLSPVTDDGKPDVNEHSNYTEPHLWVRI